MRVPGAETGRLPRSFEEAYSRARRGLTDDPRELRERPAARNARAVGETGPAARALIRDWDRRDFMRARELQCERRDDRRSVARPDQVEQRLEAGSANVACKHRRALGASAQRRRVLRAELVRRPEAGSERRRTPAAHYGRRGPLRPPRWERRLQPAAGALRTLRRCRAERLFRNIADAMQGVPSEIVDRPVAHFRLIDPAYAAGVVAALAKE